MIELIVPLSMEGIVTVECVEPGRGVVHREVQRNIITDEGLNGLKALALGDELMHRCVLGRSGAAAVVGDDMDPGLWTFWTPACGGTAVQAYDNAVPTPQERSIVAVSEDDGGTADVHAYVAGPPRYWSLTRTRIFNKTDTFFQAGTFPAGIHLPTTVWRADGWGFVEVEASYIKEVCFVSGRGAVNSPRVTKQTSFDCLGGTDDFYFPSWIGGAYLWNRIVLAQSLGFEHDGVNIYYPWEGRVADVLLTADGLIRVTMELRVYPDVTETVQEINVDGTPTTCTTRVIDVDSDANWGVGGFLDNFGNWNESINAASIAESNTLPVAVEDSFVPAGMEISSLSQKIAGAGAGEQIMEHQFGAVKGLFDSGIGSLLHGNFSSLSAAYCYATVFDPKIAKTDLQRHDFRVRYTWSRR